MTKKERPVVCVDFDGVLNTYTGWKGPNNLYVPRPGAKEFMMELQHHYTVVIFSTRPTWRLVIWLKQYQIPYDKVVDVKIPAVAYIDDRALKFEGDYDKTLKELFEFKTHWETSPKVNMNDDKIRWVLQNQKNHLRECRRSDDGNMDVYWIGALDCVDNLADMLGVDLE